jgi:hypothetical protein
MYIYPQINLSHPPTAPQNQWTFIRVEELRRPDDEKGHGSKQGARERRLAEEKHQAELEKSQEKAKQREMHVRLATIVKDRESDDYKKLLALQGDIAQDMLNHLQAVHFSLPFHRCYPLCTS